MLRSWIAALAGCEVADLLIRDGRVVGSNLAVFAKSRR